MIRTLFMNPLCTMPFHSAEKQPGDLDGYWGPITSSVNWCENNYVVTPYIAEFWNTVSNIPPFIVATLALIAMYRLRNKLKFQYKPFYIGYGILMFVWAGSATFHATLSYTGQLLDELPMIYGTLMLHHGITNNRHKALVAWPLAALGIIITVVMIVFRDSPLPLQLSFGLLNVTLILRSIVIAKNDKILSKSMLLSSGFIVFTVAFILWVCDQAFCTTVRPYKFHALWHLLSGTGVYLWIQFAIAKTVRGDGLMYEDVGLLNQFNLPFGDVLPFVVNKTGEEDE